jgi:hypothetical protein
MTHRNEVEIGESPHPYPPRLGGLSQGQMFTVDGVVGVCMVLERLVVVAADRHVKRYAVSLTNGALVSLRRDTPVWPVEPGRPVTLTTREE